jgi:hypothetical protein
MSTTAIEPRITPNEFMDIVFSDDEPDSDDEDFEDEKKNFEDNKEDAQTFCDKFFQLRDAFDNTKYGLPGQFPIHERYGSVGSHPDNRPEIWGGDIQHEDFFFFLTENDILSCNPDGDGSEIWRDGTRIMLTIASWPHGGLLLHKFTHDSLYYCDWYNLDYKQFILTALRREIWDRANNSVMDDYEMHNYIDDVMCPTMVRCLANTDMDVVMALVSVPRFNPDDEAFFPHAMTSPFENLPESFRALPDIVLRAAQEHWDALSFAIDDLKTEDFCRRCVEYHWRAIIYVPRDIQTEAFLIPLIEQWPCIYAIIPPELQNVRAIALAAVSNKGTLLECVPYRLRMDYEINLAAVSNDGMAILYISRTFRGQRYYTEQVALTTPGYTEFGVVDEALLVTAVTQNPGALEYIIDTDFHWFGGNNYQDQNNYRYRERLRIWNSCRMRIVAAAANACRLKWCDGSKSIFLRYLPRCELESDLFLSGLLHLCPFVDLAYEGRIDSDVAFRARHFRWMYALVDLDPKRWPTIHTLPMPTCEEELQAMYEGHPFNHSLQREIEQELEEELEEPPAKRQRMSPSE